MPQIPNIEILETPRYPAKGLRAESTRAVTGSVPSQWVGGRLFGASAEFFFFYENDRYSETKSQKIVPKAGNEPSLRGLQTGHRLNSGSCGKKSDFWAKNRDFGPKKSYTSLL